MERKTLSLSGEEWQLIRQVKEHYLRTFQIDLSAPQVLMTALRRHALDLGILGPEEGSRHLPHAVDTPSKQEEKGG